MPIHSFKTIAVAAILSIASIHATAQEVKEPKTDSNWVKPYPPFRIAGNLYYVGTYDLACYLITTPKGNILINTGLASSVQQIKKSIEALGFKFADTKILLTTQAHFDHMGAMASIKETTHAKLMVDEKEADVLASGGQSDYELGKYGVSFKPVQPDRLLKDGDTITLGGMNIVMLHHPGHTKGSCSFLFTVNDKDKPYRVLIANLPSIITDKPFTAVTAYPTIASDYAYTLQSLKKIRFNIWLASHAGQFDLHEKHQPGSAYNPAAFVDQQGFDDAISSLQKQYDEKMKKDAEQ